MGKDTPDCVSDEDDFKLPDSVNDLAEAATVLNNRLGAIDDLHSVIESPDIDKKHDEIDYLLCATGLESSLHLEDITGESAALEAAQQESLKDKIFAKAKDLIGKVVGHMHNLFGKFKDLLDKHLNGLGEYIKNIPSNVWDKANDAKEYTKAHPIKTLLIIVAAAATAAAALPFLAELPAIKDSLLGMNKWINGVSKMLRKTPLVGVGVGLQKAGKWLRISFPRVRKGFVATGDKIKKSKLGYNVGVIGKMFGELRRVAHYVGTILGTIGAAAGALVSVYIKKFTIPLYKGATTAGQYVMNTTGSATMGVGTGVFIWGWITALNACIIGTVTFVVGKVLLNAIWTVKHNLAEWGIIDDPDKPAESDDLRDTDPEEF